MEEKIQKFVSSVVVFFFKALLILAFSTGIVWLTKALMQILGII